MYLTRVLAQEGRLTLVDVVMVRTTLCREASVHVAIHGLYAVDGDVVGQHAVHAISQLVCVDTVLAIKVGHHPAGMNASVGPAGTRHSRLRTQQRGQDALQLGLYRVAVGLYLPAMIVGSVVL